MLLSISKDLTFADLVQVVRSQSSVAASSAVVPAAAGAAGGEGKDTDSAEESGKTREGTPLAL